MRSNIWAIVEMIIMRSTCSCDRESRPYLLSGEADWWFLRNCKRQGLESRVISNECNVCKKFAGRGEKINKIRIRDDNDAFTNMNRNLYRCSLPGLCCLDSPKNEGSRNQV